VRKAGGDEEHLETASPALAKVIANEPSRLESLVIAAQVDTYCADIDAYCGVAVTSN
jgi:hypothetical protein